MHCPDAFDHEEAKANRKGQRGIQWVKFPLEILLQGYKLGPSAAIVFNALMGHAFYEANVFPSKERLMDLTGLKRTAVFDALKRLRKLGLIRPGKKHGRVASVVILPMEKVFRARQKHQK